MHTLKCLHTFGGVKVVPTPRGGSQRICPAGAVTACGEYSPDEGFSISAAIGTRVVIEETGKEPMIFYTDIGTTIYTMEERSFIKVDTTGIAGAAYIWTTDLSTLRDHGDGT